MKITAIKAAVKTRGRVNIFVDGKYSFSLDELQLVSSGLHVGKEISAEELEVLKDESAFGKAYARALDYIMRRPRSEQELRDYAYRKKWPPELAERVFKRLQDKGYINDAAFASFWVKARTAKPTSKRRIMQELKAKGVRDETTLEQAYGTSEHDEREALRAMIEKKAKRYDDPQKLIAYLLRQGFNYDLIQEVLSEEHHE